MQKIDFILFLIVILSGCSVLKNRSEKYTGDSESTNSVDNIQSVKSKNLTENSFFLEKAEIEILTPEIDEKFLGSIKFQKPGKYLISLKSMTGIEAARIFISEDTILVNDRINRKLYSGSPDYLLRKIGISESLIPIIFGDLKGETLADKSVADCIDERLSITFVIKGVKVLYVIDCKRNKIISAIPENTIGNENVKIGYSKFTRKNELIFPGQIDIIDFQRKSTIKIKILKFASPWDGEIEFVPGNRYELIRLL